MKVWVNWDGEVGVISASPAEGYTPFLLVDDGLLTGPICATHDTVYTQAEDDLFDEWGEPPCVFVWREPSIVDGDAHGVAPPGLHT